MGALLKSKQDFETKKSIKKGSSMSKSKATTKTNVFNFRKITKKEQELERINVYSYII